MNFQNSDVQRKALKLDFDRDGYIAIQRLFDADKMAEINRQLDRYIVECVPKMESAEVYYEDKDDLSTLKQMQKMHRYDEYFAQLIENSQIHQIAETALGEEVNVVNLELFNKPAGVGQATPAHQDGYFFHLKPSLAVTGWLALEPVDEENGCIHYVRGSHKSEGFRPHARSKVLGFSQGMTDFGTKDDKANTVSFPGGAGTFLMHDSKTVHWAGPNLSKTRSRRALGFIYFAKSAQVDIAARNAYAAKLEADLREQNKL